MNILHEIGLKHGTDKATAHQYLDFYEANLPPRSFSGNLLEIGVKDGASLKMWREYYPQAKIWGIDITAPIQLPGCNILKLDQCDVFGMLEYLPNNFDIIIDDGSHMTMHQQISMMHLWQHQMTDSGIYVMEDVHTSFYGSYFNSKISTVEFVKRNFPRKQIREWCRVADKSDSYTMLINKKPWE